MNDSARRPRRNDPVEQAAARRLSYLPHRLRHGRKAWPDKSAFGNIIESDQRQLLGYADSPLRGYSHEAQSQRIVPHNDRGNS